MNLHHNLRRNKKGIGTIFGMIFFILIVIIVFASFMIILNQNTSLENTVITTRQMDNDRATEQATVSILNPAEAPGNKIIYVECNIANDGPLSAQLDRLWIKDITTNQTVNAPINGGLVLNSGSTTPYFNAIGFPNVNSSSTDLFNFWFITARGNAISASPSANQLNLNSNGLVSNSTAGSPASTIQLSLTTKSPNNLIYLAVIFDDDGQVTPFSTPSLNWIERGESRSTITQGGGDSFLETWYAIMPSSGTISISFTESNGEGDFYWAAMAFAVSGVNTASPFDGTCKIAVGNNNPHAGSGTQPSLSVSTTNAHDLVVGALAVDWPTPAITPGSGFTQVMGVKNSGGATQTTETTAPRSVWIESMLTNTTTTNMSVNSTFTPQDSWAFIADAIKLSTPTSGLPLTLSPTSGPVGQIVTVSGSGFAANSALLATFAGSQVPFSFTTDGSGNIPHGATFTVPAGATTGSKEVVVIDSKFNYANATFTVTSPNIAVIPTNGAVGTSVAVTGSNFVASSTITLTFDGNPVATIPSIVTTNAAGGFSATFVVSGTAGGHTVLASDGINSANCIFTVTSSITVAPTIGLSGTQVTVSGTGFTANSNLLVTFGGAAVSPPPANAVTDATGSFSALTFNVPSSLTPGAKIVNVTDTSGNFATTTFTLMLNPTVSTPTLIPSASIGYGGSAIVSVTVSGGTVTPTGTVQFQVSTDSGSTWSNLGAAVTLSGGSATSTTYTPTAPGSNYQFRVSSYSGDTTYIAVNTPTLAITLTVNKSSPTTSTSLSFPSRTLGLSVTDTATVYPVGFGATPTGSVTFYVSTDGGVTFNQLGTAKSLTSGSATSDAYTATSVNPIFYFRAVYSGDTNYLSSQSGNTAEPLTITQATATVSASSFTPSTITLGNSVTVSVSVTGPSGVTPPTGNVQFQVSINGGAFANFGSPVALSASSASTSYTPQTAANYNFKAVYQGDSNYVSNTVGAASGTLTMGTGTAIVGAATFTPASPITLGTAVTVLVSVTAPGGSVTAPTGNVQFQVSINGGAYTNFGSLAALSGGSASVSYTPQTSTSYNFRAVYQGDSNYVSGTTGPASNTLIVNQGTAVVSTPTLYPSASIGYGGSVTVSVSVSGGTVTPTGTVQFQVSTDSGSTWSNLGAAVSLSGGSATSTTYTPTASGSNYQFRVSAYSGDANYNAVSTPTSAVTLTVTQATATTSTILSSTSISLGQSVTDTVTVSPVGSGATPTGSVAFQVSSDGGSTWAPFDSETLNAGTAISAAYNPASTGSFYFRAVYSGDSNYAASQSGNTAEPLTIAKATATVGAATFAPPSPITLGAGVTVSTSVTGVGGVAAPTGNVQFQVSINGGAYTNFGSLAALSGGSASVSYTPQTSTSYNFRAVYQGDSNYVSGTTGAASGTLTVNMATANVGAATFAPASPITLGTFETVSVSVTGPGGVTAPTGNVQFQVSISGGAFANFGSPVALSASSASVSYTPQSPTTYSFQAVYQGDTNYNGATGAASGTLTVNPANPTVPAPTLTPASPIALYTSVTASITIPSVAGVTPTGTVTFQYSTDGGTTWNTLGAVKTLVSGSATSDSYAPPSVGSNYRFNVVYSGDSNYNGATGSSASLTVNKATASVPAPTLNPSGSTTAGNSVSLSITVSGAGATPTGTATFQVNINGAGWSAIGSALSLDGTGSASTTYTPTASGSCQFEVVYSGDGNYNGITGSTSPLTVNPAALSKFAFGAIGTQAAGVGFNVVITAQDTYGNTVTSYTGNPTLSYSAGTISPSSSGNFVGGTKTVSVTVTTPGTGVSITATDGGITGISGTFTVNPGALASFTITGYPTSVTAGTNFGSNNVVVTAYDAYGNVKTNYAGSVYFTSTDAQAVLPYTSGSRYTFVSGDSGVHTFAGTGFTLRSVGSGTQTITVTDGTISQASNSITISPSVLAKFAFSAIGTQTAGTAYSITVTAQDTYGNTITSYVGNPALTSSSWTGSQNIGAFSSGTKTGSVTSTVAGSTTITATDGVTGTSNSFTVNPGVLDHFTFSVISTPQTAGTAITGITITAQDVYGNTVTSYASSTTLTETGGGAGGSVSQSPVTFAGGVWSGSLTLTKSGSAVTITATGGGKTGTSNSFTVNPGALTQFVFSTISSPQTSGTPFTVTITAEDQNGNTVTTYGGTPTLRVSSGTVAPTTVTFTNGVWTGSVTVTVTSSRTVYLYINGYSTSNPSNSFLV